VTVRSALRCILPGVGLLLVTTLVVPPATGAPTVKSMPTTRPSDRERGRELWLRSCWQCHGEEGKGDGPASAAMVGGVPTLVGKVPPEDFDRLVTLVLDGRGAMPAYREDIDKHDARRILVYLQDALQGRTKGEEEKKKKGDEEDQEAAN
jgi:mono/diheme cytochrome c family protein